MPTKYILTHGILIALAIRDARRNARNRAKFDAVLNDNIVLSHALLQSNARIMYLGTMMVMDEVDVDEFDKIILNDPLF